MKTVAFVVNQASFYLVLRPLSLLLTSPDTNHQNPLSASFQASNTNGLYDQSIMLVKCLKFFLSSLIRLLNLIRNCRLITRLNCRLIHSRAADERVLSGILHWQSLAELEGWFHGPGFKNPTGQTLVRPKNCNNSRQIGETVGSTRCKIIV